MIRGVLLAAGASRRMGCDKLNLPWRNRTVLTTTLGRWQAVSDLSEIILVQRTSAMLGPAATNEQSATSANELLTNRPPTNEQSATSTNEQPKNQPLANEQLTAATNEWPKNRPPTNELPTTTTNEQFPTAANELLTTERPAKLRVVLNPHAEEGMGSSLRLAAQALPEQTEAVVVGLADMPEIAPTTLASLIAAWRRLGRDNAIVAPLFADRRGHPVIFGSAYFSALRKLSGDRGAKNLLQQHADNLTLIPVDDPGVVFDIDTPADLEAQQCK